MEPQEPHRSYATGDPAADGVLAARCGVALVAATGALSATIIVPADSGQSRLLALIAIAVLLVVTVAAEARARHRRPERVAPLAAFAALAAVVMAQSVTDTDGRTAVVLYPTVIVYTVYFCHPAVAAALVAAVAITRFVLISAPGADVTALSSFVTVSTLILTAGVVWVLRERLRAHDVVGRQGGDEFLVVAPDLDPERADTYAQRLQAAVATAFADDPVALTLTIGTATYPGDAQTAERVIDVADQRLCARKSGRGAPESGPTDTLP